MQHDDRSVARFVRLFGRQPFWCYRARVSSRLVAVIAVFGSLASTEVARAQSIPEFYSARAIGWAGARSLATGPEAIWLNPAGLGFTSQYILQADYAHDTAPNEALPAGNGFVVSLVDSKTNPTVPTGLSYRYVWFTLGENKVQGSVYDFAIAVKIIGQWALGLHVQYLSYTGVTQFTGDVGTLIPIGPVTISGSGFNLLHVNSPDAPQGFDVGAAVGDGKLYRVGFDFSRQWPFHQAPTDLYNLGAEVTIAQMVPIRGGFVWDTDHPKPFVPQYITVGTGFYISFIGFDASYRRDIVKGENAWAFSVKIFQ
jgi:hypothetical protein